MTARRSRRGRALAAAIAAALAGCGSSGGGAGPGGPPDPCAAPLGPGWIAWSAFVGAPGSGQYDVRLAKVDGTCVRTPAAGPDDDLDPQLSTSLGALVHVAVRSGTPALVVTALASGAERTIDTGVLKVAAPALSPDGTQVAFQGFVGVEPPDVYVVPLAGGTPVLVASSPGFDGKPAWAPDGSAVYFLSNRSGRGEIWRAAPDGSTVDPALVTTPATGGAVLGRPAPSPDGRSLAFPRAVAGGQARVVVRTLAGGAERVLADADDAEPAWDATGARVAVTSRSAGTAQVVVRDAATGAEVARPDPATALQGAPAFAR